jgi:hypothetical protein
LALIGTPTRPGEYPIQFTLMAPGTAPQYPKLLLTVHRRNLASFARTIIATPAAGDAQTRPAPELLRDGSSTEHYGTQGAAAGRDLDEYGYEWAEPVKVGAAILTAGPATAEGGWFEAMDVQYRDRRGGWKAVPRLRSEPPYTEDRGRKGDIAFELRFLPVTTTAIRVIGPPGGVERFTTIRELAVYEK